MTTGRRDKADREEILREVEFRPMVESDLDQLATLIAGMSVHSPDQLRLRDVSGDYYHWMYYRNPAGRAFTCCAIYRGRLIASFALAPKRFLIEGREMRVGKTMEIFTHPDFQGLGLMSKVAQRVFESARAGGIDLWYVAPSKNSYPIFKNKWGYIEAFDNHYRAMPLKPSAVAAVVVRPAWLGRLAGFPLDLALVLARSILPSPSDYWVEEADSFGAETDALWERCRGYRLILVRDSVYMTWRYLDNPDRYIPLHVYERGRGHVGILVLKHTLRRGLKVGELVDFLCPPEDRRTRLAMFRLGVERLYRDGCAVAETWAIENTELERDLVRVGFVIRRKKLPILLSPDAELPAFYDRNAWFLTQGDGNDI